MFHVIIGGRDVTGSAERAPFVARPFDRLAVGEITVTYLPDGAAVSASSGRPEGRKRLQVHRVPTNAAEPDAGQPKREEVEIERLIERSVTGGERAAADRDAGHTPTCALTPRDDIAVGTSSPDPQTSEGADGRLGIPSSDAAGAKCGGVSALSLVGPASAPGHGYRKSEQAVPYSPWTVRPSTSFRSIYP